jgi:hypothetical protein
MGGRPLRAGGLISPTSFSAAFRRARLCGADRENAKNQDEDPTSKIQHRSEENATFHIWMLDVRLNFFSF